jgi:hypothetical protein
MYHEKHERNHRQSQFNFQWLVRTVAPSLFRAFTYRSRPRLFIDQLFLNRLSDSGALFNECKAVVLFERSVKSGAHSLKNQELFDGQKGCEATFVDTD